MILFIQNNHCIIIKQNDITRKYCAKLFCVRTIYAIVCSSRKIKKKGRKKNDEKISKQTISVCDDGFHAIRYGTAGYGRRNRRCIRSFVFYLRRWETINRGQWNGTWL